MQFHKGYAIYYSFTDDTLNIERVVHGSRDRNALFAEINRDVDTRKKDTLQRGRDDGWDRER